MVDIHELPEMPEMRRLLLRICSKANSLIAVVSPEGNNLPLFICVGRCICIGRSVEIVH